jgi:predicted phage gp36 major capsid-like protein
MSCEDCEYIRAELRSCEYALERTRDRLEAESERLRVTEAKLASVTAERDRFNRARSAAYDRNLAGREEREEE